MRSIGDEYVKAEFRRTRSTDNPLHIVGFLSEWKTYLDQLPPDPASAQSWRGAKLDPKLFEKVCILQMASVLHNNRMQMSGDQISQLYELMKATREVNSASGTESISIKS